MASATPVTFNLSYLGTVNLSAAASALLTIDDSKFLSATNLSNLTSATATVTAFSVAVSGATSGTGTFGLSDVTNWLIRVSAPLNLGADLVGQAGFSDFNWCASGFSPCVSPAPGGT